MTDYKGLSLLAKGNIPFASFVKVDTGNDNAALVATANSVNVGISQEGTHDAPGLTGSTVYAAATGQNLTIYSLGDVCRLLAGSGGWTRGQLLKSDANGAGVPATSVGDNVSAVAIESASTGEYGRVQVVFGQVGTLFTTTLDATTFASSGGSVLAAATGTTYLVGVSGLTVALPATVAGVRYVFYFVAAGTLTLDPVAADKIMGDGFAGADNVNAVIAGGIGTRVEVIGDGADGWYVTTTRSVVSVDTATFATISAAVAAKDSGKVFIIGAADLVATLPSTAAGLRYTFIVSAAALSTGTGFSVSPAAADKIMGNGFTSADNKDAINSGGGDREGDLIEVTGDGADGWYITRLLGTWARE